MAFDNIGLVRRFVEEVWNKGNMTVCDELLSPKLRTSDPLMGTLDGIEAAKQHIRFFRTAFPDFNVVIDDIGAIGDKVYVRWTATGTQKGALLGIVPTNEKGIVGGMTLNRLENGKFIEAYYTWDVYKMIETLGLLPPLQKLVASSPPPTARV
jgi:predicted ester cyclase